MASTACSSDVNSTSLSSENSENLEDFTIVWLYGYPEEHLIFTHVEIALRMLVNSVKQFDDPLEFLKYIESIKTYREAPYTFIAPIKYENLFVILSDVYSTHLISTIHDLSHVEYIYIYNVIENAETSWTKKFLKIRGPYYLDDLETMLLILADDVKSALTNLLPITIFDRESTQFVYKDLTAEQLDFVWFQVLIRTLQDTPIKQTVKEIIDEYKPHFTNNIIKEMEMDEFVKNYSTEGAIHSYSAHNSWLKMMLNKACRTEIIEVLYSFRFLFRNIRDCLIKLQETLEEKTLMVYRQQFLRIFDLEEHFDERFESRYGSASVIFQLHLDKELSVCSFGYESSNQVLISVGSIFRILSVDLLPNSAWLVKVVSTATVRDDLRKIMECIEKEIGDKVNLRNLGAFLINNGQYERGQRYLAIVGNELLPESSETIEFYRDIGAAYYKLGKYELALNYLQKSLHFRLKSVKEFDCSLRGVYADIAFVNADMHLFEEGLKYCNKVTSMQSSEINNSTDEDLMRVFIAQAQCLQGKFETKLAQEFNFKALEIALRIYPKNSMNLAILYNNIASCYSKLREYNLALEYNKKALKIKMACLPANHPSIATSYNNIGEVCLKEGWLIRDSDLRRNKIEDAIDNFKKCLAIQFQTLPRTHPHVIGTLQYLREAQEALILPGARIVIKDTEIRLGHSNLMQFLQSMNTGSETTDDLENTD